MRGAQPELTPARCSRTPAAAPSSSLSGRAGAQVDIVLNFRTGVYNKDGMVCHPPAYYRVCSGPCIARPRCAPGSSADAPGPPGPQVVHNFGTIAKDYLRGWFVIDVVSCFPGAWHPPHPRSPLRCPKRAAPRCNCFIF
jgi:hypothetical protein